MEKKRALFVLVMMTLLCLSGITFMDIAPSASATGSWEDVTSISKTIEIPPGEEYFAYFNKSSFTIVEMHLPTLEAGLSQKAKDALAEVPSWLYDDLAKKFGELGDTNIDVGDYATPTFADMDADGDLDLSTGSLAGPLFYYENVGTQYRPIFVEDTEMYEYVNSFWLEGADKTALALVDYDADGDNDLVFGEDSGDVYFIDNIGSPTQAIWNSAAYSISFGGTNSHPTLADLDDDGDFDMAVGCGDGNIYFFENTGTPESPGWGYSYSMYTGEEDDRPVCFADMDDDNDYDLSVGDGDLAILYYYRNIGDANQEIWAADATMYSGVTPEYGTSPGIADLNGDQRLDLVVGGFSGRLYHYRNTGSAEDAQWLIWSFYQVIEGYNYYPKDVFLNHRAEYHMDRYADLILNAAQKYRDEIGFAIAHMPTENLKAMSNNQTQLFVDNAELIYEIDQYLDYVEVIEKEDYTTTRYKYGKPGHTVERELPKDIYYWFIVHPKITDENVFYIHPDDSDPNHPTDPGDGGRFWREYLFYHNDSSYPPDNSGSPNDGVDDYPQDLSPPLLMDALDGISTLWDGATHHAPGGRPIDYGEHAVIRVSNWVGWTLVLNQQEVSDSERPIQPVRIAHHHNGNCGELQDLTTAAARTALIPAAGVMLLGEDHVWIEFFENGWHQWDNYWSHGGSVIDNWNNYWGNWGQRGGSGVWKHGGDDDAWEVTDHYIPDEDLNHVTIRVLDNDGYPVDGARVLVLSYWLTVTIEGYQIDIPFPGIWNYTDSNGETVFKLATQEKSNGNKNFTFKIISKVGDEESGKIELEHGQDYTFEYELEGSVPNPSPLTNPQPNPNPLDPEYILGVSYEVKGGAQHPRHFLTGNYHPEEIPPERSPESYADDYPGNHIDSFITTEQGFFDYMKGNYFDSYEYAENVGSDEFLFDMPDEDVLYFVLSNRDAIETTKIVELTLDLYKCPNYDVKIVRPGEFSQLSLGEIINISGIVTNETELLSLQISTDNGESWIDLGTDENHWAYDWNTSSLALGRYTIEVRAMYELSQASDTIEIELSDMEPPLVSILAPHEYSQHAVGAIITISGAATDNLGITSLQLSTDGGFTWTDILPNLQSGQWSHDWITAGLCPDYYVIEVQVSDGTNDVMVPRNVELLDMEEPTISISNPAEGSRLYIGPTVMINGTAADNIEIASLELSTDGGENWIDILSDLIDDAWSYEWETTGLSLGQRSLMVKASDGTYTITDSIDIELADMEGKLISIAQPQVDSKINIGSVVTISGSVLDDVEIEELKLSKNGGATWVNILPSLSDAKWSYDWNTKGLDQGAYFIKVKGSVGTYQETKTREVELADLESPGVVITYPSPDEDFGVDEIISVIGTASDNVGITELRLSTDNGVTWTDMLPSLSDGNWSYDWDTNGLIGGSYTIMVTASDDVNSPEFTSVEINLIDTEMPILEFTAPIGDFKYDAGDMIPIEGKASDNARITSISISTDDGDSWVDILPYMDDQGRWTYIWDTSGLEAGSYDVWVKISDGTYEIEDSLTFVIIGEEKQGKEGISFMLILLVIVIAMVMIIAAIGIALSKRRHKR